MIGIIALAIAYHLISSVVNLTEKQIALQEFSKFSTDVQMVCYGEINNSIEKKYLVPFAVRVIYATDSRSEVLPKVVDLITNQQISEGSNLCLQFKDEPNPPPRCEPEEPLECRIRMPYIGVLPESEDIWMMVSKILGKPRVKEYDLLIQKVDKNSLNISVVSVGI